MDRGWSRRRTAIAACLVVVMALGAAALVTNRPGSRDLVVAYVDAIARGDVATANELAPDGVRGALPSATSTRGASPMQVVSVDDDGVGVVTDEGGAGPDLLSYGVRYAVDDRTYRREVQVTRDGGWVSGEWRIRGSLAQRADVALDSAIDHVDMRLGGLTTKVTQEAPPVVLYPGAYEVRLGGGRMMTFGTREVIVADEPVDLDVYATNDALGPAAMTAARDAAKDALTSCLSGGGTVVACDGGAISQSGDELGSSPTWELSGAVVATPDPTIDLRYEVTATVVARGSEGSGAVAEERFTWDGDVYLSDITSDDATTTARWFSSTSRR